MQKKFEGENFYISPPEKIRDYWDASSTKGCTDELHTQAVYEPH